LFRHPEEDLLLVVVLTAPPLPVVILSAAKNPCILLLLLPLLDILDAGEETASPTEQSDPSPSKIKSQKSPAKLHVKSQNHLNQTKQTRSNLQKSFSQFRTIN
jgi:hypothetical protein